MKFQISDKIELRQISEVNAAELFEVVVKNYEHLRPFLYWVVPEYSLESAEEFIAQTNKAFAENTSRTFGIFFDEKIVGVIGFVNFNWSSQRTEIGYWIAKDFEGKGIITKSCKTLINYAFDELKMNRIEIRCACENVRSCNIPQRLGYKLEGVLRQFLWRHTRFYDMAIYGMLAEEWSEKVKRRK